jgi:hypothetical protein
MLDEATRWDDLVIGLRPATRGTKGKSASRLVSVGAARLAKASSEGWCLRLHPNNESKHDISFCASTSFGICETNPLKEK